MAVQWATRVELGLDGMAVQWATRGEEGLDGMALVIAAMSAALGTNLSDLLNGLKGGTEVTSRDRIPVCLNSL